MMVLLMQLSLRHLLVSTWSYAPYGGLLHLCGMRVTVMTLVLSFLVVTRGGTHGSKSEGTEGLTR
jgi:hypothetical protein